MRRMLTLVALAVAVASCSDSNAPDTAHAGVYNLVTINGATLPKVVLEDEEGVLEVTAGRVTLDPNGHFQDKTDLRNTFNGEVTTGSEIADGTYVKNGSTITFTMSDGSGTYAMDLSNNTTLTQIAGTLTFVYQR